jgi:peptide-methionine (S)-S-oxide reductase
MGKEQQTATLAGGCFWCLEAIYDRVKGVVSVESGYSGGHVPNPSYQAVGLGTTGHAEVVQITFDADIITYKDILNIFFTIHDPTTLNRQGADVGTQYRSAIFYHDEAQRKVAEEVIQETSEAAIWDDPIVTEVALFEAFYVAEDYHQGYFARNPNQAYCRAVIEPKVVKFRQRYAEMLA